MIGWGKSTAPHFSYNTNGWFFEPLAGWVIDGWDGIGIWVLNADVSESVDSRLSVRCNTPRVICIRLQTFAGKTSTGNLEYCLLTYLKLHPWHARYTFIHAIIRAIDLDHLNVDGSSSIDSRIIFHRQ